MGTGWSQEEEATVRPHYVGGEEPKLPAAGEALVAGARSEKHDHHPLIDNQRKNRQTTGAISNTKKEDNFVYFFNLCLRWEQQVVEVEEKGKASSFMVPARDLSITWAEDSRYWSWLSLKETASGREVEAAHLLNVCWLEIHGRFDTGKLSSGIVYEIVFVAMLKDPAYGWEVPVNLRLLEPNGKVQEHKERLVEKRRGEWIEIVAGEYMKKGNEKAGDCIDFSMFECEGGLWKRGLIIKGVLIRPKK